MVYINKLIPGRDYEIFQWLNGDGAAYIDTKIKGYTEMAVSAMVRLNSTNISQNILGARVGYGDEKGLAGGILSDSKNIYLWFDRTPTRRARIDKPVAGNQYLFHSTRGVTAIV